MNKIKWRLANQYSNGGKVYKTSIEYKKKHNKYRIKGSLSICVNGRNTAYITYTKMCLNFSNLEFGFNLSKHFEGHNASHKARAWFRYLTEKSPDYCEKVERKL